MAERKRHAKRKARAAGQRASRKSSGRRNRSSRGQREAGEESVGALESRTAGPGISRWYWAALASVGIFSFVFGFRQIFSPDIGFYLATGRHIVESGSIPILDTLTWTRSDQPYVNLWWLYQTVCWLAWSAGGSGLLRGIHLVATLATLALTLPRAQERNGKLPLFGAALLLIFAFTNLWEARPHVASWLYLSLVLWILERDAGNRAGRAVWLIPPILALWINTHALFSLGFVVLGAHVVDRLLDPRRRGDKTLWAVGATSLVACLANPFFLAGLLLPIEQFGILRSPLFTSPELGIAEYLPLFDFSVFRRGEHLVLFRPNAFAMIYAALAVAGLLATWRNTRWSERLLFVGFGYLFVTAFRNFGFFFLVSFPLVSAGLEQLSLRFAGAAGWPRLVRRVHVGVAIGAVVLTGLALDGRLFAWQWGPQRLGSGFNASVLPVGVARFMVEQEIDGRILNSWGDGGYIAFATRRKTFIDGRMEVMGERHYRRYLELGDPSHIDEALERFQFDVAVVPHDRIPLWLSTLYQKLSWRIVYADDLWALLLRPGFRPDLPSARLAEPAEGRDYPAFGREDVREILAAEEAKRAPGVADWWRGRDALPLRALRLSGFHLQTGEPRAAAAIGLEAMRESRSRVPGLYLNVGSALLWMGDQENADRSYDLFLRSNPSEEDVAGVMQLRAPRQAH